MGNPFSLQDFFSRDFAVHVYVVNWYRYIERKDVGRRYQYEFQDWYVRFYVYSEMLLGECALNLLMIRKDSSKENNTLMGIRVRNVIIFV